MKRWKEISVGLEFGKMNRPMIALPVFIVVALTLSFALADQMERRALSDRLSFDDSSATNYEVATDGGDTSSWQQDGGISAHRSPLSPSG